MHVASFELCKELFAVSGWDSDDLLHYLGGEVHYKRLFESDMFHMDTTRDTYAPAYSLGYLLRKLPKVGKNNVYAHSTISDHKRTPEHQEYYAVWECEDGEYFDFYADTPEDALCKLATELCKQGTLTPPAKESE